MRLVACVVGFVLAGLGGAFAGDEAKCAAQYRLDERLILEWAAIGGDPHAQFAVAQCAFPLPASAATKDERVYALKWTILAMCDTGESQSVVQRDRLTRRLKDDGDLSFRRFGGLTDDEKWSRREKRFQEYRAKKRIELEARFAALQAQTNDAERQEAKATLTDELSRLGARGLVRLAEMTDCPSFEASSPFAAAAWAAAAEVWTASGAATLYGEFDAASPIATESAARLSALAPAQRRLAELEKARILKSDPRMIADLEDAASLARLEELRSLHADGGGPRSLTTAVQFALEALGWIAFVNGPDNDYGPATIEAARRAQAGYGEEASRWLSPRQSRQLICDAALEKSDPVSYYHLALIYSNGWGFREDQDRALLAIDRARTLLNERLVNPAGLPNWQQTQYPNYRTRIENARNTIVAASALIPAHARAGGAPIGPGLCR